MITTKKAANAVGGKTARACDSCLRKQARWYCLADEAFLCQACDSSVHSANQLASRHERIHIEFTACNSKANIENYQPSWHQSFTRKARTPRNTKNKQVKLESAKVQPPPKEEKISNPLPLVPEIGVEEEAFPDDEDEELLLYRVPVFDPFAAEMCELENNNKVVEERFKSSGMGGHEFNEGCELDNIHGFFPSDVDLAEFAADVESLLGGGLDEDSCGIEGLGLLECKEEDDDVDACLEGRKFVKVEDEEDYKLDTSMEMTRETIDWNFGYESPVMEEEEKVAAAVENKMLLRLDYEAVMAAWDSQGSPWTAGIRPEFNPNDCWPDFTGMCPTGSSHPCVGSGGDGGREARVSRYREKRRTRLFAKKIRYEVRKLNAEKRPRMKGRFVKRTSFAGPAFPYLINK